MRSDLSHLPIIKQRELARVLSIIHDEFEDATKGLQSPAKKQGRILKVILYGSYARGASLSSGPHEDMDPRIKSEGDAKKEAVGYPHSSSPDLIRGSLEVLPLQLSPRSSAGAKLAWVEDRASGYWSDYDILIVVNQEALTREGDLGFDLWNKVEDRLTREWMARRIKPPVSLIIHSYDFVCAALKAGKYFFADIYREGIALYELPGFDLKAPGRLSPDAAYREAKEYFDEWFESGADFWQGFEFYLSQQKLKKAAFLLHQAVESLYHCALLVLTNYSPQTHNIEHLRSLCEGRDARLIEAWPRHDRFSRGAFNKLKEAYVKARYSRHWKIEPERLAWLGERAGCLQSLVKTLCEERLAELKARAGD